MNIQNLSSNKGNILDGVFIIKPRVFEDHRGFFYESWNQPFFDKLIGKEVRFQHDNHSLSNISILRGLHYQIGANP